MRILISVYSLDYSGVPTYTLTLYRELERLGHEVTIYSPKSDGKAPLAEFMKVITNFDSYPRPDVILAQANKLAVWMRGTFPFVPMIFINHGVLPDLEQRPRVHVNHYIAINEQSRDMLIRQHVDPDEITIVRDFIDMETYRSIKPLQETPRVLFLSNYKKWKTYDVIKDACDKLKYSFKAVGAPYGKSRNVVNEINEADIVVGWGRSILEGMACGRAVISFNEMLGDGYLTPGLYLESRERNFGGYECRYTYYSDSFARELEKYEVISGHINHNLANAYHRSGARVADIMKIIRQIQ